MEKSSEYPLYRRRSLYFLALINADRGELETALEFLQEFVEDGYWLDDGLANVWQFGRGGKVMTYRDAEITPATRLHQFSRFWELVDQEYLARLENFPMDYPPREGYHYRGRHRH